jgi:hypothetical protein
MSSKDRTASIVRILRFGYLFERERDLSVRVPDRGYAGREALLKSLRTEQVPFLRAFRTNQPEHYQPEICCWRPPCEDETSYTITARASLSSRGTNESPIGES